jgi:hypothetical protein
MEIVLAKKDMNKLIVVLQEKFNNCIETQNYISIHGFINGVTIRNSAILEEYVVDKNKICLTCGWFQIDIDNIVQDIEYIEENSVHIDLKNGELDIDFE